MRIKKMFAAATLAATALGGVAATPAVARDRGYHDYRPGDYYEGHRGRGYRNDDYYRGRGYDGYPVYRDRGYRDYRYDRYDRCDDGVGGTVIGGVVGGLLGNEVAGRGDRAAGTIIGAIAGAVAGNAIDRGNDRCH